MKIYKKIKGFYSGKLLKIFHHLSYPMAIIGIYLIYQGEIHWAPFLIATFLINNIGASAGLHRYFTHHSFKTGKIQHWIIGFLSTISTQGSIIHWVAMHRIHHKHSDTELDPVDPHSIGFWKSFFGSVDPKEFQRINRKIVGDLFRDKVVVWYHNWYWPVISLYITILMLINPLLVFSCYWMPLAMVRFTYGINNTVNHGYFKSIGYRNFNSKDSSTNSILFHVLTLFTGESLHNNHHYNSSKYSFKERWFEFDPTATFIKYVLSKN